MMDQEIKRIPIEPNYSTITSALIARLKVGVPHETITDDELREIAGRPVGVKDKGRCYLQSAVKWARRNGIVWTRVRNEQRIVCLSDTEKLEVVNGVRQSISRKARVGLQVLAGVNREDLPKDKQREYDARTAQTGTLLMFADSATAKQLEAKNASKAIDRGAVIALFHG